MKIGIATFMIESRMRKEMSSYLSSWEFGWGNGYVLLPPNHPFYGIDYDNIPVNVHGGLTYGQKFDSKNFSEWLRNLKSFGDLTLDNCKKFDGYWMIGFDTAHFGDNEINCSRNFVSNEVADLLEQCLDDKIEGISKYKTIYLRKKKLEKINHLKQ